MSRLGPNHLVQLVDDDPPLLVFIDESCGAEATRPMTLETVMHLIDDVAVARIEDRPVQVDDVEIPQDLFDPLLGTLGYFTGRAL